MRLLKKVALQICRTIYARSKKSLASRHINSEKLSNEAGAFVKPHDFESV